MLNDLESAMLSAAAAMPWSALEKLMEMGAHRAVLSQFCAWGGIGTALVDLSGDGTRWQPGGSTRRLLLGVRDENGTLIDIAALASHRRDEWALATGDGWAIGLSALADCMQARDEAAARALPGLSGSRPPRPIALRIYGSPFDWLAKPAGAICVLDWGLMALTSLRCLGERVVLKVDHGGQDWLRARLAHGGLPRVEPDRGSPAAVRGLAA